MRLTSISFLAVFLATGTLPIVTLCAAEPIDGSAVGESNEEGRNQQAAALRERLELVVVPTENPIERDGQTLRPMHVVTFADNDRVLIGGRLAWRLGGTESGVELSARDFDQGEYHLFVPEPAAATELSATFETEVGKTLETAVTVHPARRLSWRDYVKTCLETLIEHGRDEYGDAKTPLFMAVLDVDTLRSPAHPPPLDALVRLEGRLHRRGERGTNLWYDQDLLLAMYRMTELTGDDKYAEAADAYIRHFFDHCRKGIDPNHIFLNGMPAWGSHVYWDCFRERPAGDGDGNGPHEILVFRPTWENMYRVHPGAVRRIVDGIWEHHVVDKLSGLHNRHDDSRQGCDFAFSGSSFAHAFAFMYSVTEDLRFLERAKTVAGWHWNNRHEETGLTADCPGLKRRYDGNHCFTTVVGPHAMSLLECYRLTDDPYFRDAAIGYIKAYDKYGWDEPSGSYWAMLKLDGTPVPDHAKGSGYSAYAPSGYVNVWRTTFFSYEFTLSAAQAAVLAYETSVGDGAPDAELLAIAKRWASVVQHAMPPKTGRRWKTELEMAMPKTAEAGGAYAEDYGRAISLFVHMYRATESREYLQVAAQLAEEAVDKLYHNGLFRGHAAKPYYETTNGVGLLLYALLELDAPEEALPGAM